MFKDIDSAMEMAYALGELSRDERDQLTALDTAAVLMRLVAAGPPLSREVSQRETSLRELLETHRVAVEAARSGPSVVVDAGPAPADTRSEGRRVPPEPRAPDPVPAEPVEVAPPTGRYLYRFPEKRVLGKGGMGEVLEYKDGHLLRTGALKFLRPAARPPGWSDGQLEALNRDRAARFRYEGLITGFLEHPNILPVTDMGELDGVPFIAETLNKGRTLSQLLERKSLKERLVYLRSLEPIALAMAFAHDQGVLHRDLKGPNVMIGSHGEVQVTDWGAAKILPGAKVPFEAPASPAMGTMVGPIGAPGLTEAHVAFGTIGCTSPEQSEGKSLGPQTDIYSFGVILWEILTGRVAALEALAARKARGSTEKTLYEPMASVEEVEPQAPAKWISIQRRCTHAKPEDRYASFAEVLRDIQGALSGGPVAAHEASLLERLGDQVAKHRGPLAVALVASALIAVVAAVGYVAKTGEAQRAQKAEEKATVANVELTQTNGKLQASLQETEEARKVAQGEARRNARMIEVAEGDLFDSVKKKIGAAEALKQIQALRRVAETDGPTPSELELDANFERNNGFVDFQEGRNTQALNEYKHCLELLTALKTHGALDGELLKIESQCELGIGDIHALWGNSKEAVEQMTAALEVANGATPVAANEGQRVALMAMESLIESRIGAVLLDQGDSRAARPHFEVSKSIVAPLSQSKDAWTRDQTTKRTAVGDLYLGYTDLAEGKLAPARADFLRALDADEQRAKRNRQEAREPTDVVEDLVGLARVDEAEGHPEAARPRLERAESIIEAAIAAEPNRLEWMYYATKVEDACAHAWPKGSPEGRAHATKLEAWAKAMLDRDPKDQRALRAMDPNRKGATDEAGAESPRSAPQHP